MILVLSVFRIMALCVILYISPCGLKIFPSNTHNFSVWFHKALSIRDLCCCFFVLYIGYGYIYTTSERIRRYIYNMAIRWSEDWRCINNLDFIFLLLLLLVSCILNRFMLINQKIITFDYVFKTNKTADFFALWFPD